MLLNFRFNITDIDRTCPFEIEEKVTRSHQYFRLKAVLLKEYNLIWCHQYLIGGKVCTMQIKENNQSQQPKKNPCPKCVEKRKIETKDEIEYSG